MDITMNTAVMKAESADGTLIACERRGSGPALVMVGGALCTAASDAPLAELLAPRFSVFTYDRRGRGASGDTAPYSVGREIEDLAAVIGAAGGHATVHGTSSGAVLALRAAAAGLPITHLSVYEPPFETDPAATQATPRTRAGRRPSSPQAGGGDAVAAFLAATGMSEGAVDGLRLLPLWSGMEALAHTLAYDYEVMGDGMVPTALLASVTARVMVVDGGASPAGMRDVARAVATALPHGHHRTLTGQTHEVAPHVLAPTLVRFFA
ncbi:alpha/beta hydrolase [Streptomyces kurssanovii]|nr:alpha/beta hydrolase [Streptomyces kurssanovii]